MSNIASGASVQLTHERVAATRPRWLPDDRLLYALANQGLWVISALGGTPTRLIERGANPDVSRDGTRIVFEVRGALWTVAADGSDMRRLERTAPLNYSIPMGTCVFAGRIAGRVLPYRGRSERGFLGHSVRRRYTPAADI